MEVKLLSAEQVILYESELRKLLECCMEASFSSPVPAAFYTEKIDGLREYLQQDRAYLFAALDAGQMKGFLWACELPSPFGPKFHILYFAVLPKERGRGLGTELIRAAEARACELGIERMELCVSSENVSAVSFYHDQRYQIDTLILKKMLEKET